MVTSEKDITTKAKIRNATFKLFGEYGFEATSTRQIAREAGVSLGLIRYHFGSKENLRTEVDAWVVSMFETPLDEAPSGTPFERVSWINQSFADVMKNQPGIDHYLRRSFLET